MSDSYYKPCRNLNICNELIEKYYNTQQYEKCFEGHLVLAEQGYPLAECQIGYFYYDGLGVEKNLAKAVWWTRRAADHGDRDGQCNLAWFYEEGIGVERDLEQAAFWYRQAALQDHDLAIDKCKEQGISLDNEIADREGLRKVLKCRVFPLNYLPSYKYTVICANYKGKWILSRHKKRDTWETQGGHIEDGETPLEAAKRELFEESGIRDADVYPVCDYWEFNPFRCSNGMVFLAVVHSIGELPESEMQEIGVFEELPENLTYPQTSPVLYREAEKLLRSLEKKQMDDRLKEIRKAEAQSHTEAYTNHPLFHAGSWLAKPVRTVLELLPLFEGYKAFRGLDLGSGVGRNSIPVAQHFKEILCRVDCVDILELAIEKLNENARQYGVAGNIRGIVSSIDDYEINADSYDFIMAVSALEHIASRSAYEKKLLEIRKGLRGGGVACFIVNSGVTEQNKATGEELPPQFEVNLPTSQMQDLLEQTFAGWQIIKHTVVHQKYDIPRQHGLAELETDVVTYVVRKEPVQNG